MNEFPKGFQLNSLRISALIVVHIFLFVPILQLFAHLNHMSYPEVLVLYFVFIQFVLALIPKWWAWSPLLLIGSLYAFYHSFSYSEPFGITWIRLTYSSVENQFFAFLNGEIISLPVPVALLLFMTLTAFSSISLLKWKQPWVSFMFCLVYLSVLQIFTENQIITYLAPVLVLGMLLVGVTHLPINRNPRSFFSVLAALALMSFLFSRLALLSTEKFDRQHDSLQAQAVSYQQNLETRGFYDWIETYSNGQSFRQTGYGDSDKQLGGPVQQDFTPVFNAYTDNPHYWRISTKETYTGTGWERDMPQITESIVFPFSEFPRPSFQSEPVENSEIINIQMTDEKFAFVPYTYGTEEIAYTADSNEQALAFQIPSDRFILTEIEDTESLGAYQLRVHDQNIDADLLKLSELSDWSKREVTNYMTVPETVPQRVKNLALKITQDAETQYDKVKAIEHYLKTNKTFRYSMQDAAFIPEGSDYVDHFLFESKVGYCDHFSTAMAVLVRSIGIPTRWAKGFSSGELVSDESGRTYRQITNANAHSWPEVYFEKHGWIPFEPTPSFFQPVTETQTVEAEEPGVAIDAASQEVLVPVTTDQHEEFFEDSSASLDTEPDPLVADAIGQRIVGESASSATQEERQGDSLLFVSLVASMTLVTLIVFYFFKEKILIAFMKHLIHWSWLPPERVYDTLTRLFHRLKNRKSNETIRQYYEQWILFVPEKEGTVYRFIQLYEKRLYGPFNQEPPLSAEEKATLQEMLGVLGSLTLARSDIEA